MTNIFVAIKNISEEQLREQLALFEVFTVTNVYKEAGYKVAKKVVEATKVVTTWIKKEPLQAPEGYSVDEALARYQLSREGQSREVLEAVFKHLLRERCKVEEEASEEALSVELIRMAAELYEIKEELLPSQQAKAIATYYQEEMKESFKDDTKVKVDELLKQKMPLSSGKILSYLLVQLVSLCVEVAGEKLMIQDKDLPSYLPARDKEELRRDYEKLKYDVEKYSENYDEVLQKLVESNQLIAAKNKLISEEETRQKTIEASINKLKQEVEKVTCDKECRMKNTQVRSYEAMLEISGEEVKSAELAMKRYKEASLVVAKKVEEALSKKEEAIIKLKEEKEKRYQQLENKWNTNFTKFQFEESCLKYVHETLSSNELIDCERILLELQQYSDQYAISWGPLDKALGKAYQLPADDESIQHFFFSFKNNEIGICIYEKSESESIAVNIKVIEKVSEE